MAADVFGMCVIVCVDFSKCLQYSFTLLFIFRCSCLNKRNDKVNKVPPDIKSCTSNMTHLQMAFYPNTSVYTYIVSDTQVYDSVMADVMKEIAETTR